MRCVSLSLLAVSVFALACGASSDDGGGVDAGPGGSAGAASSSSGASGTAGTSGAAGTSGSAGTSTTQGGSSVGGAGQAGQASSGAAGTGASGAGGSAGAPGGKGGTGGTGGGASAGKGGTGGATTGVPIIVLGKITGATAAEMPMIADGVALANTTMATACFKTFVLAASWTETDGLTQAQIWDKLCSGPVSVDVDMYTGSAYENYVSKTIGYEKEPGVVHMNRFFVDTAYMVADNIIHEAEGHSQGFHHYGVKATSVPYGLNDAFEACSPVAP